ncbi:MAG: replicative DNA helicase [Chthoniobacteraceae bacterium]
MNNQEPKRDRRERRQNAEFGRTAPDTHRMLPQSKDSELGLLSSILLSSQQVFEKCDEKGVSPEHFHIPAHALIYQTLREMYEAKKGCDFILLTQELKDRNQLEEVGGAAFVTSLFTFLPTAANADYYIEILVEKYLLRRIILACNDFSARAYDEQEDVKVFCDEVQATMMALTDTQTTGNELRHIKEGVIEALETIEFAYNHRGRTTGTATGYVQYDRMTNGLQPAEMTVIAARPSMGKTALGVNICENIALGNEEEKRKPLPVAIFSLEMSYAQLAQRIMCGQSRLSMQRVRDGFLSEGDFGRLNAAGGKVSAAPIYIDDTPGLRILEFKARARRAVRKLGVKAILIDYLQLMRGNSKRSMGDRQLEVSEISAGIKSTAKELNVPIIVLAQLNREADKRKNGEPKLSDLRESGSIEQDADVVALLSRPEYYLPKGQEVPEELKGKAIVTIAKQRNGGVGPLNLKFLGELTKFENWDKEEKFYSNNRQHRQKSYNPDDEEDCDVE